ncbi:TPA: hypothetical protein ACKP51_003111 [Serratia marcescens]
MTNKLSELSNPAWIVGQQEIADFMRGDEALLVRGYDPESTEPALRMYSQEYVSDLLEELEANKQTFHLLTNDSALSEAKLEEAQQRIAELSRLLTHNIERAESAEKRLATPVRLPDTRQSVSGDRYQWSDGVFNYKQDVIAMLRAAGFTVEGDE